MNAREFYELAKKMRNAQIKYNESKDFYWLEKKAEYENEIDAEIERVEAYLELKEEAERRLKQLL